MNSAVRLYHKYKEDYRVFIAGRHESQGSVPADLLQAAHENGFVLYDSWCSEPKVVFVLDPWHSKYDKDIASLILSLVGKGLLDERDSLLLEGAAGELDYEYTTARKNGKFYFGVKGPRGRAMRMSHAESYIAQMHDALKQAGIPVLFDDNDKSVSEEPLYRLSTQINHLEGELKKHPEKQNEFEDCVKSAMKIILDRSNNCFWAAIRQSLGCRRVFQIFGFADYSVWEVQKRLQETQTGYAAFMPKQYRR